MLPLACSNCWYNPLQHGPLGLAVGFCVEHKRVLPTADDSTCGRLLRKDLPLDLARAQNGLHSKRFPRDRIVTLRVPDRAARTEKPNGVLAADVVGDAVQNYGVYGTKIGTLAQLRTLPGARAEVAMLSLGRAYVARCVGRGGRWTSGLHLVWRTIQRLDQPPAIQIQDVRSEAEVALKRLFELVEWSVVMLRLDFVADVATYAEGDPLSALRSLPERAALATDAGSSSQLLRWAHRQRRQISTALSHERYARIAADLHRD